MEKKELKELIIRHAREAFREIIERERQIQSGMAEDAFEAENDNFEMTDDSNKMEALDDVEELAEVTDQWSEELSLLEKTTPDINWEVTYGSVIVTDQRNFFVGASIPRFDVLGVQYIGISPQAPLYKAMEGKVAGDVVEYNGMYYKIIEVI